MYVKATDCTKTPDESKIDIFLKLVGEKGIELYNMFKFKNAENMKYRDVIEAHENYCSPIKKIYIYF